MGNNLSCSVADCYMKPADVTQQLQAVLSDCRCDSNDQLVIEPDNKVGQIGAEKNKM